MIAWIPVFTGMTDLVVRVIPAQAGIQDVLDTGFHRHDDHFVLVRDDDRFVPVIPAQAGIQDVLDAGFHRHDG